MNTTFLKELIDLAATFEEQFPDQDDQHVDNFAQWLSRQVHPASSETPVTEANAYGMDYLPPLPKLATFIAQGLVLGYRYHKLHVKKALQGTPLITYDDFIYLALLAMNGSMTKMSLVESTINEKASGVLVINRLLQQGFLAQTADPADGRIRRISLTPAGRAMLDAVLPAMSQATTLLVGDLSLSEQQQLAELLTRLDTFHKPLYLHHKDTPLNELYQQLISSRQTS